jgi:hypothetical protein
MTVRGWLSVAAVMLVMVAVGWWSFRLGVDGASVRSDPVADATTATSSNRPTRVPTLTPEQRRQAMLALPEAHLADELNSPAGDIRRDMSIVASLFAAWRSNFSGRGNPFGDNQEITRKLMGNNSNGIIFLREGNQAINQQGELCDRWGTPFFFHAESGTRMEIRSAGPDRKLWTADDVTIVP